MKEKLVIKNFGPIKSVELELGRFNVLIGEQATGKSTVAKVLAVCRYFSYIVWNDPALQAFEIGLSSWGLKESIQSGTYIYYDCLHYSFTVEGSIISSSAFDPEDGSPFEYDLPVLSANLIPKSREFKKLLEEVDKLRPQGSIINPYSSPGWVVPTSFFQNDVARVMDNPFYLPTERGLQSVFSLGKNSIQNISDSLFNQFAQLDQIARLFKQETAIEPLDIIYMNVDGRGYVRKKNEDKFFSLFNAASGYQSTIPVVLLIKYYSEIRKKRKTFIIEEPELNLFPAAQHRVMQYMVDMTINNGNTILLTTHSPYTLTSLNNMMQAYQTGIKHSTETESIIGKKYWIKPEDVSAYMLLPDGICEDIFDREEGLIKADRIDHISGVLNKQFDDLLNIEFEEK